MIYPRDLIIIRHAESEGNVVNEQLRGNSDEVPPQGFNERHNSVWPLTATGRNQATQTGQWFRDNVATSYAQCYVSPYLRTVETARLLGLEDARWRVDTLLREREAYSNNRPESTNEDAIGTADFLYAAPLGVETFAQVLTRVDLFMAKLLSDASDDRPVVVVTHSKIMWAFRYYLDNMLPHTFYHTFPPDGEDKVQYAQIMQYERGDNKNNGFVKRRLVRAWQEGGVGTWQDISQPFNYSTNDLEQIIIDIE